MIPKTRVPQQGVVLITILLIFAATTVLVVSLQSKFMSSVRAQGLAYSNAQAFEYHYGAELLAMSRLLEDAKLDLEANDTRDHSSEPWAQPQVYPITGGEIRTLLIDLQGRFNLTTLIKDVKAQQVFIRLLQQLQIPGDGQLQPEDILMVILDWLDTDQEQRGFIEAEDDYYLSLGASQGQDFQMPGYRTSQLPLEHLSELLLLRGLSKQDYVKLSSVITLLPDSAALNINSVSLPVALALNPTAGSELVTARPEQGFLSTEVASLSQSQRPALNFNVDSQFFELRVEVVLGDIKSKMKSLIYVPVMQNTQASIKPLVLERDLGWSYYYSL